MNLGQSSVTFVLMQNCFSIIQIIQLNLYSESILIRGSQSIQQIEQLKVICFCMQHGGPLIATFVTACMTRDCIFRQSISETIPKTDNLNSQMIVYFNNN